MPLRPDGSFLEPYLPKEAYLHPAWFGCLSWALGEPEIMDALCAETGNHWTLGRTGLDRAIDQATGAEREFFKAFAGWMNENLWGEV